MINKGKVDSVPYNCGGNIMQGMMSFFKNVAREMKLVSWPKRPMLVKYTITVIATVAFVSVYFAALDFGISSLIELIVE